ncbi:MAG: DUF4124 domain-containing protein [Dokdonella sp.]
MKYSPISLLACVAVLACGTFGSSATFASEAYRWVDANGVNHYSDQPPPRSAKDPRKLRLSSGEPLGIPEPVEEKAGENQAMARAAGYEEKDIKRNCELASKNLAALTSAAPLVKGSEEAQIKEQSIQQAQGQVKLFCN